MPLSDLLDAQLVLVTGKGGTGKSTVAAAIGRRSAQAGRRTLVVEVDAVQSAMPGLLGRTPEFRPRPVGPRLAVANVTWVEALEDWLDRAIHVQRIARLILRNNLVRLFLDATPGVREIVVLSRIVAWCDEFDQVVVDMPASGHAVAYLEVPWVALRLLKTGPIHDEAERLVRRFADPGTRPLIVALPEEMVVNETLELRGQLAEKAPALAPPAVLLNQASMPSLSDDERILLERLAEAVDDDGPAAELVTAGLWEAELEAATARALARIEGAGLPVVAVPRVGALGGFGGGAEAVVLQLARALSREARAEDDAGGGR
ncbi:MAG: hypothetical protein D6798_16405 [Deltaproteobacteria bacterium]|nr:MAG: hypothetical protein D6798_16405 [Deltaproteobacteria bacterium]